VNTAALRLGHARPRPASAAADRVRHAVLAWEGVTVRDGHARLGTDDLGRLPRRLPGWNVERAIARFRARYDRAADRVDRRAGVRESAGPARRGAPA
jgi:hypothetical protein